MTGALTYANRLFWIVLRRLWEGWSEALIIVKPETVVYPKNLVAFDF